MKRTIKTFKILEMPCHVIAEALSIEVESNKRWFPDHTGKWSEDVNRTNQNLQDPGNACVIAYNFPEFYPSASQVELFIHV